ncbi:MAG: type II toxin-antitoxin system VapC family toxin [Solirubrobacterales bacterium]
MADAPSGRGLLDTSVIIGVDELDPALLPAEVAISTLTLAELTAGPSAVADDELERARRQNRLQRVESGFESLAFDRRCVHAYGLVYAAVLRTGRKARGGRVVDLMIAATALAHELTLYTLNRDDLRGLDGLIEVVDVGR